MGRGDEKSAFCPYFSAMNSNSITLPRFPPIVISRSGSRPYGRGDEKSAFCPYFSAMNSNSITLPRTM